MDVTVEIRRGTARFPDREPGRMTWHAFSFGPHYDPAWAGFGPMTCHDEHLIAQGRGFETHRHSDVEIVTWVLSGAVRHADSIGNEHTLVPGEVGHLRAGSGVEHTEVAAAPQTRFVQVWLVPDEIGLEPAYEVGSATLEPGVLSQVAHPRSGATLHVARLGAGDVLTLPRAPRVHAFVSSGALLRSSLAEPLGAGDAFLLTDPPQLEVTAAVPTELLVWTLPGDAVG